MVAESGKHLHMEKPGGTDPVAFAEMIDAVKRGGKVFHTGYMYRYNPNVEKLMELAIAEGNFDAIDALDKYL